MGIITFVDKTEALRKKRKISLKYCESDSLFEIWEKNAKLYESISKPVIRPRKATSETLETNFQGY